MGHFFSRPKKQRPLRSLLLDPLEHEKLRYLLTNLKNINNIDKTINALLEMIPCDLHEEKIREPYEQGLCEIFGLSFSVGPIAPSDVNDINLYFLRKLASLSEAVLDELPTPNNLNFTAQ